MKSDDRHRLTPRARVSATDGTVRVVFSPGPLHPQTDREGDRDQVPDRLFGGWLQKAVNAIVAQGDRPSGRDLGRAYLVLVKRPLRLANGAVVKVSFPLIWACAKSRDGAISALTDRNYGVVWTWFATNPMCSPPLQRESQLPLTVRIAPFLRDLYGDEVATDLACFAADRHFREHGTKDIVTWQQSASHIAVTGFEPRAAEFELQDFVASVIVVE